MESIKLTLCLLGPCSVLSRGFPGPPASKEGWWWMFWPDKSEGCDDRLTEARLGKAMDD